MRNDKDKIEINEALQKICKHPLFTNSSIYSRLLHYLVEKALANEDVKEFTIGNDLFEKNYSDDKNDGTVRSYMYNLRKKLADYYQKEGADETIVFNISKGQYNLHFISRAALSKQRKTNHSSVIIPVKYLQFAAIFTIIGVVLLWGGIEFFKSPVLIWEPFFNKDQKNLVVVSDQYVVHEKLEDGALHAVLYETINNSDDFLEYTNKSPKPQLKTTDYTLMSKMAPYCIKLITEWFIHHKSDYDLKLESDLNYEDIRNHNLVFVGQFKTMNMSKSFFLKDSKVFSLYKDGFKYTKDGNEKVYNTQFNKNSRIEYAMVSFTSLSPGKKAIYFVSNNDIGVMATLSKFTDNNWLKKFNNNLGNKESQFNALFEVSGLQRTDTSCKLVALEVIE